MTDKELLQMALDCLQRINLTGDTQVFDIYDAPIVIPALRARLSNEFNPDWDAMAVMVEEQQRMSKRIEELEAALAQPKPEPVAWRRSNWSGSDDNYVYRDYDDPLLNTKGENVGEPLYTAPPKREWIGLTKTEFNEVTHNLEDLEDCWIAIEAKLKEKNNG